MGGYIDLKQQQQVMPAATRFSSLDSLPIQGPTEVQAKDLPPQYESPAPPPPYSKTKQPEFFTYSIPFGSGVAVVQNPAFLAPSKSLDDVIIVPVRLSQKPMEKEPPSQRSKWRSLLCRVTSRIGIDCSQDNYRIVQMPRREYLKHHQCSVEGEYAGTEAEREWTEEMIEEAYGRYWILPPLQALGSGAAGKRRSSAERLIPPRALWSKHHQEPRS